MAATESTAKEVITFGAASAVVWPRGNGMWQVSWSQGKKGRSSTFKRRPDAIAKAKKLVRELVAGLGSRSVSIEEAEVLQVLYRVCGDRSPIAVLGELEDALKTLKGVPLRKAVEHWRATGMADVERKDLLAAVNAFLDDCERRRLKGISRSGLRKELQAYARANSGLAVCEIEKVTLALWIDRGSPKPRYFNNRLATWKTFLNWARNQGWWPKGEKHPGELIARMKQARHMPPIWSADTVEAALQHLSPDLAAYVALGCYAGLRPFEITRLRWEDFNWERNSIHVHAEVAGKTNEARYVPIEPCLVEWLVGVRQKEGDAVMANSQEYASLALREAGIITSWPQDVMRHSYISHRIARGDGAGLVAEQSGNSERIIKKHYRHPLWPEDGKAYFAVRKDAAASPLPLHRPASRRGRKRSKA